MQKGYYFDNGELIDPDSIELSELCNNCRKNNDGNEKIPCNLNRIDQMRKIKSGNKFRCYTFESRMN